MKKEIGERDVREIKASEILVRVTDENTGETFERVLPMDYYENHNGIRLRGENMRAEPSEIVFLSEKAADKIRDVTGRGPDTPPHHGK